MNKVLFINACVRPESRTCRLAREVLKRLPGESEELRLYEEPIEPLDQETLEKRTELVARGDYRDSLFRYAKQFAQAADIVVAAPYWDLSFPSILKVYLEQICVTGLTFQYTPEGIPEGLCRARRIIYVTTAGGPIYQNLGYDYVKALAEGFFGIPEILCYRAENLDVIGADVEGILQEVMRKIRNADM